nr:peptide-N-glycosidase F-related protein [uncultured Flavobacterium sp.]
MKKTLLTLSLFTAMFAHRANAQTTVEVYDNAVFYGMYQSTVDTPGPTGAIRHNNTSYGIKLTDEQIASFGNTLTLNIQAASLCDNYDRIGNANIAFVPKGATSYVYNQVDRIEMARFITPFMLPDRDLEVPYTYDVTNLIDIFKDPTLSSTYDFWIELEIAGYQGGVGQGGAAEMYPTICAGRDDVYRGSLQFETSGTYVPKNTYFKKLSYKFELKNYVQATPTSNDGTDVLGSTERTIAFDVPAPVSNAKYYFINSNHGSGTNGEEYVRRWHSVFLDGSRVLYYRPGGKSCEPYRQYNTQGNGIYGASPQTLSYWTQFNNWCPGDAVPIRVVDLGTLSTGSHNFKITVNGAQFNGGQGYFPMSVYVQGEYTTAGVDGFTKTTVSLTPNPVQSIATINTNGEEVASFTVVNTLGQQVAAGRGNTIDMTQLQSGIYVVKASLTNGQTSSSKVIKK